MMSSIKAKDTRPELLVRTALHKLGLRYRLHQKLLPGKPDLVFPRHKCVVFIHGCFWHHHNCRYFKWPKTNEDFWRTKIERNTERDARNIASLISMGWRVCVIWECSTKAASNFNSISQNVYAWILHSGERFLEFPISPHDPRQE